MAHKWPDSLSEHVAHLWQQTMLTATEIGCEIGKTRNAVLGKINRLGLLCTTGRIPGVNKQSKAKKAARRPASRRALRPEPRRQTGGFLPQPDAAVVPLNIPFMETESGQCRFIMAGNERVCCGKPTIDHSSWCLYHYRVVFKNAS